MITNFLQIFLLFQLWIIANGSNCTEKTSVIINGTEYRMFFRHKTSENATLACRKWGDQWKSGKLDVNLMQVVNEKLQNCLEEMVTFSNNHTMKQIENDTRFHLGGILNSSSDQSHWVWKNGDRIPYSTNEQGFQKWAENQPEHKNSSPEQRRCMSAIAWPQGNNKSVGHWIDEDCEKKLGYICQRDVAEELLWGYDGNEHAVTPGDWGEPEKTSKSEWANCSNGSRQSPVDIKIINSKEPTKCENESFGNAVSWNSTGSVSWEVKNTGRFVEIKIDPPNSLYTCFDQTCNNKSRLYVDYMHLKWGENEKVGSEHTISGTHFAGELQIFHLSHDGKDRHALAFMIHQRTFRNNDNWNSLLNTIVLAQNANTTHRMKSPPNHITSLLQDSANIRGYATPSYITGLGFRYDGSLTHPPCTENIIWTVYPRPIDLSISQLSALRFLRMEGVEEIDDKDGVQYRLIKKNNRPIQPRNCHQCYVNTNK